MRALIPAAAIAAFLSLALAQPASGGLLVVTTNLRQVYPGSVDPARMQRYVDRLLSLAGRSPDVLLLQEVYRPTVRKLARALRRKTGYRYVIAAGARARWRHRMPNGVIQLRETAVLVKVATMSCSKRGSVVTKGKLAKENVWAVCNGLMFLSAHLQHAENKERAAWTRQIIALGADVIGGDFNANANLRHYGRMMKRAGYQQVTPWGGVDFIFTKSGGHPMRRDTGPRTYSDHRLRAATL